MDSTSGATEAFVAIDVGTTHMRARLFATDGCELADALRQTPAITDAPGSAELDPELLWSDVCDLVLQVIRSDCKIRGVGVTAQLGTVLIDAGGEAIGRSLLWADSRAHDEAEELRPALGALSMRVAGRRLAPELLGPRLLWLRRNHPHLLACAASVVSLKDFLVFRLTGNLVTDETHASYTGLLDVDNRAWSDELVRISGFEPRLLPRVANATATAGVVTARASARTGISEGVPVAVGAPDGTMGLIGAGAVRPSITVDVAGTTDTLLHTIAVPIRDPEGAMIVNAHAAPGLWTAGGPTGLTGGTVAWVAQLLGLAKPSDANAALAEALLALPPGAGGLLLRPAFTGSRFPDWLSRERGLIAGIDVSHGPLHFLRAAQEGAAFTVASGLDVLRRCGCHVEEVVVVGGLASNPSALQLRADALGVPVVTLAKQEASSVGAAMLAGVCAGVYPNLAAAADVMVARGSRIHPDKEVTSALAGVRAKWDAIGRAAHRP